MAWPPQRLGGFVTARTSQAVAPDWAAETDRLAALIVGAVYLCICLCLLLALGRTARQRTAWLALRPAGLRPLAAGLVIWAGAYLAALVLYSLPGLPGLSVSGLADVLWAVGADNGRLASASPGLTAIILVRICVLVPLAEELVFRGAVFTWLRQRLSATWTILLTGIAFATIHQLPAMLPLAAPVEFHLRSHASRYMLAHASSTKEGHPMRIVGLPGSLRAPSVNHRLLRAAAAVLPHPSPLAGKPVAVVGASPSRFGALGARLTALVADLVTLAATQQRAGTAA